MTQKKESYKQQVKLFQLKAIIFDLDGTLIHSAVDFMKLKRKTLELLALQGLSAKKFSTQMKTYKMIQLASTLFDKKGFTKQDFELAKKKIEEVWDLIELESVKKTTTIEGVEDMLINLKKKGFKIGIVTRGCRKYAIEVLKILGLLNLVDVLVGRDDTPEPKPSPEPLIKAIKTLGFRTGETIMVGDNIEDAQCALSAKVRFIGVTSISSTRVAFEKLRCEAVLSDVKNLIQLFS